MSADCLVEINATVEFGGGSEPFVERRADDVAVFVIGTPAVNGEERAAVNFEAEFFGMRNVERAYAVDEVVCGGHVAPRAELVDFDTDRVDDVVDAVLHNDGACSGHVHFDGKSRGPFEAVCRVGDAAVFAQNACAAHGAADNRDVVESFAFAAEREVIGPVLSCDGIAEADESEVLFFGEDVNRVEEVNPVCFAGEVVGECCRLCEIPIAVFAARKRPRDGCAGVHLCKVAKV